jgi:hypothetical protein
MKKFSVILLILLIGVYCNTPLLWAVDLTVKGHWNYFMDDSLEQGKGFEARVGHKWAFLWGSYDTTQMRLYGQRAGDIELLGVGGGVRLKLYDGLFLNGQIGYFHPSSTMAKDPMNFAETLGFVIGGYIDSIGYPPSSKTYYVLYDYDLRGNIGGTVGLDFSYPIYKGKLLFNLNTDYRFLKLPETFKGIHSEASWIEFKGDRNFSGAVIGVGLIYKF